MSEEQFLARAFDLASKLGMTAYAPDDTGVYWRWENRQSRKGFPDAQQAALDFLASQAGLSALMARTMEARAFMEACADLVRERKRAAA